MENIFGYELILNLYDCSVEKFNRPGLETYFIELCNLIDMKREDLHFWDYEGIEDEIPYDQPHLVGTSAVQFITTSNITVHTLDLPKKIYINIFSCKKFDPSIAKEFTEKYFESSECTSTFVERR